MLIYPDKNTTLSRLWWPLMLCPTIRLDRCLICGRTDSLEQHHMVRRGSGELYLAGRKLPKPTVTLCGCGNNLTQYGRYMCHGRVHHSHLHFAYVSGNLMARYYREPTTYTYALEDTGWRVVWRNPNDARFEELTDPEELRPVISLVQFAA